MVEICMLGAVERRFLSWMRAADRDHGSQLQQLRDAGTDFVSIGHLLALKRGVADPSSKRQLALAACGDPRDLLQQLNPVAELDLPCFALVRFDDRHGRPTLVPGVAELRALRELGVPIECGGCVEWEQGKQPEELVFGAMLRARRELERAVGRAPILYDLATRRPAPAFLELLGRAGFTLSSGEAGSGADLVRRSLRDQLRRSGRSAAAC